MSEKKKFLGWDNLGTALITGASAGMGAEFARQLAEKGFNIVLTARRKNRLEVLAAKLSQEYSIKTEVFVADLSKAEGMEIVVEKLKKIDDLDILVNNAGYGISTPFLEQENHQPMEMINVMFVAPLRFCQIAINKMMQRKRGVIINNASISALVKSGEIYAPCKAALVMFTESIKTRIQNKDIHFQALCPGFTYTEFHDTDTMKGFDREEFQNWMSAEEVVRLSLENIKSRYPIYIPGEKDRETLRILREGNKRNYLKLKIL
jgi:short-subunit dehydrogenase